MAYKFQMGPAHMSGALVQSGSFQVRDKDDGTLQFSVDTDTGNVDCNGTLTCDTSLTVDAVTVTSTELGYIDGLTLGTAAASKVMTWDASSDWTAAGGTCADLGTVTTVDINGGTIDGTAIGGATPSTVAGTTGTFSSTVSGAAATFTTVAASSTGTFSGIVSGAGATFTTVAASSTVTALGIVSGASFYDMIKGKLRIDGTAVTATGDQLNYNVVTAGAAAASKALVLDASSDSSGMRSLTGSGDLKFANLHTTADAYVGGDLVVTATSQFGGNVNMNGAVTIGDASGDNLTITSEQVGCTNVPANVVGENDFFVARVSNNLKVRTRGNVVSDIAGAVATTGLTANAGVLEFKQSSQTALGRALADADLLTVADNSNSYAPRKILASAMKSYIQSGAGDSISVSGSGDHDLTLQKGVVFCRSSSIAAARTWTLPTTPDEGDIIVAKASNVGAFYIRITASGDQTIDGETYIDLQSNSGSVSLCYVDDTNKYWKIY